MKSTTAVAQVKRTIKARAHADHPKPTPRKKS
jgi:hypothetical protein